MANKRIITLITSFIVVAGLYNLIVFLVRQNNELSFWLSYGFIMFAMIMFFVSLCISGSKSNRGKVTGLSISVLSFLYFAVVLVFGTILMFFPTASLPLCLIPQAVLLAIYLLIFTPAIFSYINSPKTEANE